MQHPRSLYLAPVSVLDRKLLPPKVIGYVEVGQHHDFQFRDALDRPERAQAESGHVSRARMSRDDEYLVDPVPPELGYDLKGERLYGLIGQRYGPWEVASRPALAVPDRRTQDGPQLHGHPTGDLLRLERVSAQREVRAVLLDRPEGQYGHGLSPHQLRELGARELLKEHRLPASHCRHISLPPASPCRGRCTRSRRPDISGWIASSRRISP